MIFEIKAAEVMAVVEMESVFSTPMPSFLETPPRNHSSNQNQLTKIVYKMINIMEHFVTDFQDFNPISTLGREGGGTPLPPPLKLFEKFQKV